MSICNDTGTLDASGLIWSQGNVSSREKGNESGLFPKATTWTTCSAVSLYLSTLALIVIVNSLIKRRRQASGQKRSESASVYPILSRDIVAAVKRKQDFVSRAGSNYGYAQAPSGYIDDWRPRELPSLIPPLLIDTPSTPVQRLDNDELEVYLDYAGAALPSQSLLRECLKSTSSTILANPHSTGPAASRTSLHVQRSTKRVLDHFQGNPGRFAGMAAHAIPFTAAPDEQHPGYEISWTSGTTEALRLVAERFPFSCCGACGRRSKLIYPQNAHTSVVGMRAPAMVKGATFRCLPLLELYKAISGVDELPDCRECQGRTRNLLVLPAECNFGGDRPDVESVVEAVRKTAVSRKRWYIMLDLAKAASTGPVNLNKMNPDLGCVSFYKMFGEPTGLGALFVKRSAVDVLMGAPHEGVKPPHHYFGGGSVDAILPRVNFHVPRSEPSLLASLAHGTPHFRGIVSLSHGFDELVRVGGMERIMLHAKSLACELVRCFRSLSHANGEAVVVVYGAWTRACLEDSLDTLPGPTVPFNLVRSDGSYVGYNEVSKLAALNRPPLQMRTGCFCNPGACQDALQLSDAEVQKNYYKSGHVCGDQIDILNGNPTGAIRASFGKDSMWEDLDALLNFVQRVYVNKNIQPDRSISGSMTVNDESSIHSEAMLSEMYIFPIKSCAAQRVSKWTLMIESGRLEFDREFALVDSTGSAMRLQCYPQMSQIQPLIDTERRTMTVTAPGMPSLHLRLDQKRETEPQHSELVKVCGNRCGGNLWGDFEASEWFSSFLGVQCWLARHYGGQYQVAQTAFASGSLRPPDIAFANEAPLLLVSEHSVGSLNRVLTSRDEQSVQSRHFRPNFVVKVISERDSPPQTNPEDRWTQLSSIDRVVQLDVVGQCARCAMVDVDPDSGMKGKTLRALADYRRELGQIMFGVFLKVRTSGAANRHSRQLPVAEGDVWLCS